MGNYIAAVALCGMVSEMVAITYFRASNFTINGKPMDDKVQKRVSGGKTFERFRQERKTAILEAFGVISAADANELEDVRVKRRRDLHWASRSHATIKEDAYFKTCHHVQELPLKGFNHGKIVFNPVFFNFLVKEGFITVKPDGEDK